MYIYIIIKNISISQAYRYYIYSTRKGEEEHLLPGVQLTINQLFFLQKAQVQIIIIKFHIL